MRVEYTSKVISTIPGTDYVCRESFSVLIPSTNDPLFGCLVKNDGGEGFGSQTLRIVGVKRDCGCADDEGPQLPHFHLYLVNDEMPHKSEYRMDRMYFLNHVVIKGDKIRDLVPGHPYPIRYAMVGFNRPDTHQLALEI